MNYKAFCGYWFYGGATAAQTASFFASWGLIAVATTTDVAKAIFAIVYRFRRDT